MRARLRHAIDWRMRSVTGRLDALLGHAEAVEARIAAVEARIAAAETREREGLERLETLVQGRILPALEAVVAEDSENRRRLHALRARATYGAPFEEADPLVSVTIATQGRGDDVLVERTIASLLAQTHENIEVIVVGDAAGPEVERALATVDDCRVRYSNLTQRVVAHPEERQHWRVGSTMARNEAARTARGSWLLHFDDDDALRPTAIAELLELARSTRTEVVYGGFLTHRPGVAPETTLHFPPTSGRFGWQGALVHAGLRFFERELVAVHLDRFGDQFLMERMLRAGVSFSMLERVVWDYYPSSVW